MDLWSSVLIKISEKISKPSFETWFQGTNADFNNGVIIVNVKNEFAADWLENRYKPLIFESVKEATGQTYEIKFISSEEFPKMESLKVPKISEDNSHEELKNLIQKQNDLINKQQDKIEELEQRIRCLEEKIEL